MITPLLGAADLWFVTHFTHHSLLITDPPLLITHHCLSTVLITGEYQEYYEKIYGVG